MKKTTLSSSCCSGLRDNDSKVTVVNRACPSLNGGGDWGGVPSKVHIKSLILIFLKHLNQLYS